MQKLNQILIFILLAVGLIASGCEKKTSSGEGNLDVQFEVPANISLEAGATELSFRIMFGKAPKTTDKVVFAIDGGAEYTCGITKIEKTRFYITLADGICSGEYKVYIRRASAKKLMGETSLVFSEDIDLSPDSNVYGIVSCGETRLKDVLVSDGVEVVKTDENGVYQFKSEKENRYVFISVPSGYKVESNGVLPVFSKKISDPKRLERADFYLTEDPGQENHTMLVFGDMHLANRGATSNNDINQFYQFTDDVNKYVDSHKGDKIYALTLGDMTWDLYWYDKNYSFPEYLKDINAIKGIQVFHTIGNHDHDMNSSGDFFTVSKYRETLGPNNYSFNIGKVHYIAIDDIECTNPGNGDREYKDNLVKEALEWLEKDLAFVPKSTPLVIFMHAPVYNYLGLPTLGNASDLESLVKGYSEVHFLTGHTHKMYNVEKSVPGNIYEHNSGAVCATWWWTGKYSGISICQDGTPGGYRIMDVKGTDFSWTYKPTGKSENLQFRTYDRNTMDLSEDKWITNAQVDKNSSDYKKYQTAIKNWSGTSTDNYVYINVWDYDKSWKIDVTENGKPLEVSPVYNTYDPLHIVAYSVPGFNMKSSIQFGTSASTHIYRVQASAPNTTLEIKVTDRFGREYTETMTRPKEFSINAYK